MVKAHLLGQPKEPGQKEVLQAMAIALKETAETVDFLEARIAQQDQQLMMMSDLVSGIIGLHMGVADNIELHPPVITLTKTETGVLVSRATAEQIAEATKRGDA